MANDGRLRNAYGMHNCGRALYSRPLAHAQL